MGKNLGGHELTIQDSGAPRGERNHWEVSLNGVVLYSDYNGKKANQLFDAVESALTDMAPKSAQVPSQGCEAVAIVCGSQVQWLAGAGKVPDRSPLYTHPADQVAEGVPRELLERVAKPVETQYDRDQRWIALEELRALLEVKL